MARDLLALWGWQAAQREQQQAQQTQQSSAAGAGGEEGASPSSNPLPPLNFPYSAYVESTPWVEGLAGLNGEGIRPESLQGAAYRVPAQRVLSCGASAGSGSPLGFPLQF